jgi:predicted house-cleaning noncanonical NTP pyrophosphatase (MazG superfamily)
VSALIFSEDVPRIDWAEVKRFDADYGMKGASSLTLPRAWTPAFALVSAAMLATGDSLTEALTENQIDRLRSLADDGQGIIIRSSVVGESIWERGTYLSKEISSAEATFNADLASAANEVIASARGRSTGLMIQRFIRPKSQGEFGNLLRISKTRDHWEVSDVEVGGATTRRRLNSQRDRAADPESQLHVRSGVARERLFGGIGAWLNNELLLGRSQRFNCEWITDNQQFYLVQLDEEDEDLAGVNPFQVRIPPAVRPQEKDGHFLKPAKADTLERWDKLLVLRELWENSATHKPTLFFIGLAGLPTQPSEADKAAFEADFYELIGPAGIIVRTSVAAGQSKIPNLPRTECLTPAEAVKWCFSTAKRLAVDHDVAGMAFIVHRFVAARASVWARAEPGNPNVEINALWGLPDALQYCPYDIWEVHVPTGIATEYPDYKSDMLISKPDGSWDYVRVKNELARSNSIGSNEAKELATRSIGIAERLGRACHIMWFVGCVDNAGFAFNIPWYWTEAHPAERNPDRAAYRTITVIDEETLDQFIAWEGPRTRQALALKPTNLDLMRNTRFIEAVGKAAKDADVPVVLSGSPLAHAYYQLRKEGCAIVSPSEKEHSRIRRTANFGKLVRDKIPSRIAERHEVEVTRKIPLNLVKGFLVSKLFEEALEVREAQDHSQKTEELADLFEVFRAIAKIEGISLTAIKQAADQKKRKAGGFEEGLVLIQTGIASASASLVDLERSVGDVLPDRATDDTAEIPFSFFGFMELDRPRSILFEEFGVRLEVSLRPDRIDLKIIKGVEQLNLPLDEVIV